MCVHVRLHTEASNLRLFWFSHLPFFFLFLFSCFAIIIENGPYCWFCTAVISFFLNLFVLRFVLCVAYPPGGHGVNTATAHHLLLFYLFATFMRGASHLQHISHSTLLPPATTNIITSSYHHIMSTLCRSGGVQGDLTCSNTRHEMACCACGIQVLDRSVAWIYVIPTIYRGYGHLSYIRMYSTYYVNIFRE